MKKSIKFSSWWRNSTFFTWSLYSYGSRHISRYQHCESQRYRLLLEKKQHRRNAPGCTDLGDPGPWWWRCRVLLLSWGAGAEVPGGRATCWLPHSAPSWSDLTLWVCVQPRKFVQQSFSSVLLIWCFGFREYNMLSWLSVILVSNLMLFKIKGPLLYFHANYWSLK